MAVSAPKKPKSASAPSAPKKPTSKSKTGNSACSQAASNWQLAIRGKATIEPDTYKTLAKCRAMTRTSKNAEGRARAGYNLSDQGANAIKGRLQSRFDRNLITQKSRDARVKELLAGRKEKQAAPVVKPVAAPAPAKFSRNGELAPGRELRGRKYAADSLKYFRRAGPEGRVLAQEARRGAKNFGTIYRADDQHAHGILRGLGDRQRFLPEKPAPAPAPAPAPKENPNTFQPKTVHVFDTHQHGSGEMKRGYVAKITGTHPKYNLERQFLNGPNDRGTKTVTIKERGIYEMQSKDFSKPGSTERTYELHGRNKVRTIRESLNPRTHHVPIEDNKSIGRVARLLTLFGKKKAAAPAPPQAAPMAAKPAAPPAPPAPAKFSRNGELAPGRGTTVRSGKVADTMEARASKTLQREANRNAIPLSFKEQVPKGYTAEVFQGKDSALTPKFVKRVTGSTGIQRGKVGKKNLYSVVSLADTHYGFNASTGMDEKHATRMAKILDYVGRRAQRTTGGSNPIDAMVKNPESMKQYRTLFAISKRGRRPGNTQ